ncbi:MAG: SusC/RagA family TonB-linked outer membrane protein [Bacteroidales bacterium]|nr:SusC/RagA family TonB-linked outer membrane protein [Bacteroidales bacterium]
MRKITVLLAFLFFAGLNFAYAQTRTINGTVTSADNGQPLPGVTVQVKGTTLGTITDLNGKYSINVDLKQGNTLVYSFVGMGTQEIVIGKSSTINVVMKSSALAINEVVVTALGITREKKALGYATQQVSGATLNQVKTDNVISTLAGRASGVDIKTSGNFGGGTNIVIRGVKSLTGNNQPLFVVDGVPVNNNTSSSSYQTEGGQGYDYGTVASDINPNDIKSVSILKGAAATALYGSRAANGVIMITTKTGSDDKYLGKHGIGISFSSNITVSTIDKSTFPTYQTQYGAGYGPFYSNSSIPYLYYENINGKMSYVVPTTEDASFGAKFDPSLMVYQWDAFVPQSPNYGKATPWVAAKNGPITFFNTGLSKSNTLAVDGRTDKSSFRFSYTNYDQTGIMPNQHLKKNSFSLSASQNLTKNLTVSANANFIHQYAIGRNGTGYMGNILTSFRQWWEMNVDVKELKAMYIASGYQNTTWNMSDPVNGDYTPIYWNNYYWERWNNYENDSRDHLFGNVSVKWNINDYLTVSGHVDLDTYNTLQEEHLGLGGVPAAFGIGLYTVPSGYSRENIGYMETNYNLMVNFTKNLTSKLNLQAMVGGNIRRDTYNSIYASTNGGLIVPGVFAINNSLSAPLAPIETAYQRGVNSLFASASLGYNNLLYLDATLRADRSSTLPVSNNTYMYPSVSGSFIFSNLLHADWLPFAKVRASYAEVGNDAPVQALLDTYTIPAPFGSVPVTTVNGTKNNNTLKPERTMSWGAGLTLDFLHKRLGFDGDVYLSKSIDQIMPVSVSNATGYYRKYVNAGTIQNKGVELNITGIPIQTSDFRWNINVNWTLNRNKVLSLYEGHKNLQLGSFQGGVSIDAQVGKPYGVIEGNDFVYNSKGQKLVSGGYYEMTSTFNNVIGNTNPLWQSGITNSITYKNWSLSFLISISKGGSVFSLDQYYGQSDGIYATSAGNNAKGHPKRDPVSAGGGVLFSGVNADGSANTTYVEGDWYAAGGYAVVPDAGFVYDASYVKLREATLSYTFPSKMLKHTGIRDLTLGFVGNNLWILFKRLPYADPEAGLGAGNMQGWQSGVMPTTRNFGFNLNVKF